MFIMLYKVDFAIVLFNKEYYKSAENQTPRIVSLYPNKTHIRERIRVNLYSSFVILLC